MFRMEDGAGQVQDLHHLGQAQGPEAGHQDHHLQGRLPHHQEVVEVDLHGLADHLDRHLVQQDLVAGLQHQERLQVVIPLRAGEVQDQVAPVQEEGPGLVQVLAHHQVAIRSRLMETHIRNKPTNQRHQILALQNQVMEDLLGLWL